MPTSKLVLNTKVDSFRFKDAEHCEAFTKHIGLGKETIPSFLKSKEEIQKISFDNATYKPQDSDYIRVPFRLLSATIVGGGSWKATDFSNEAVLRASISKLIGKPAYTDHDCDEVENVIGVVETARWSPATADVPAGIEGVYKINAVKHPDLAMSLLANPPEIQSSSVTVDFEWEPSHAFKDTSGNEDEFWFEWNLGNIAPDGKMVCRVVTNIVDYYESSLVTMGADPYAKILAEDGSPINIDRSAVVSAMKAKEDEKDKFVSFIKGQEKKYFHQESYSKNPFESTIQNSIEMSLKAIFARQLNVTEDKVTDEMVTQFVADQNTKLTNANTQVSNLTKEKETLSTEVVALKNDKQNAENALALAKPKIEYYDTVIEANRKECQRLYGVFAKENKDETIVDLIKKANDKELESYIKMYGGKMVSEFGATCKTCGSKEVSFRSSVGEGGGEGEQTQSNENFDPEKFKQKLNQSSSKRGAMDV